MRGAMYYYLTDETNEFVFKFQHEQAHGTSAHLNPSKESLEMDGTLLAKFSSAF